MLGIVLPLTIALASVTLAAVDVRIPVKVVVVININVATVPIAVAPMTAVPGCPKRETRAKSQSCSCDIARIIIRRVRISRRSINHRRIIGRNIDNFRIGRLNDNDLLAAFH
jgi:hypothetical protein